MLFISLRIKFFIGSHRVQRHELELKWNQLPVEGIEDGGAHGCPSENVRFSK